MKGWKMCDYRALFGALFEEFTQGYSHWAWVDTDAFVGNLRAFMPAHDLELFDIITVMKMQTHQLYTSGLVTVVKNNDFGRSFWKLAGVQKIKNIVTLVRAATNWKH